MANTDNSPTFLDETNSENKISTRRQDVYFASRVHRTRASDLGKTKSKRLDSLNGLDCLH